MTDVTPNSGQVPLDAPLRGASFGQAFARFFKKYVIFHGRASRSEFWWWFLANFVISGVLYGIGLHRGQSHDDQRERRPDAGLQRHPDPVLHSGVSRRSSRGSPSRGAACTTPTGRARGGSSASIPFVGWIILLVFFLLPPNPAGARFDR